MNQNIFLKKTIFIFLLTFYSGLLAQSKSTFTLNFGASVPTSTFGINNGGIAALGGSGGFSITQYFSPTFGIGLNLLGCINPVHKDLLINLQASPYKFITASPYIHFYSESNRFIFSFDVGYGAGYYMSPSIEFQNIQGNNIAETLNVFHHQFYGGLGIAFRLADGAKIGLHVQGISSKPTFEFQTANPPPNSTNTVEFDVKITTINPHLSLSFDLND